MCERLLAGLESRSPSFRDMVVEYKKLNDYELLTKLDNGSLLLYDDYHGTFRFVPSEYEHGLTEEECRREFGRRLRTMIERRGITQREFAIKLNMKEAQLSQYILGRKTPSFYTVTRMVRELCCSMDDLRFDI